MTASYQRFNATLGVARDGANIDCAVVPSGAIAAAAASDAAAVLTAIDAAAAAIIAITGDTYSTTTKQFAFGGATGLTHAQFATVGALLNTAFAAALTTKNDVVGVANADVSVQFDATAVASISRLGAAMRSLLNMISGSGSLTP